MYLGFAGRVSQQASASFLLASDFFRALRARMSKLSFEGIPDGLVIGLDSFPLEGQLRPEVKKVRKMRNTLVRNEQGELHPLPSMHSASMSIDHSSLVACKVERDVAILIAKEVERQAAEVFGRLKDLDYGRFCAELHALAATMPATKRRHNDA